MTYTTIITLLAVFILLWQSNKVGSLRGKLEIKAPAVTGNEEFERAFRAHQNSIEQFVMFVPCLWLSMHVLGDVITGGIGAVWIIGRILYARTYMAGENRAPGMWLTFLSFAALFLAAIWGVIGGPVMGLIGG